MSQIRRLLAGVSAPRTDGEPRIAGVAVAYRPDHSPVDFSATPRQGRLGNCWILAPMLAIHTVAPNFFRGQVSLGADSRSATVSLFAAGRPVSYEVSRIFPVSADDTWAYAVQSSTRTPGWVGMIEKAASFALADSYRWSAFGFASQGFPLLCGVRSRTLLRLPSLTDISDLLAAGHAIAASTHPLTPHLATKKLRAPVRARHSLALQGWQPPNHVMVVSGVDLQASVVLVRNPWQPETTLRFRHGEFRRLFISLDVTRAPVGA